VRWPASYADAGCAEAHDVFPDSTLAVPHVPLKLLGARQKSLDAGEPFVDKPLVLFIELPVLPDELDLPLRELLPAKLE